MGAGHGNVRVRPIRFAWRLVLDCMTHGNSVPEPLVWVPMLRDEIAKKIPEGYPFSMAELKSTRASLGWAACPAKRQSRCSIRVR